jgi:hypothetical protein
MAQPNSSFSELAATTIAEYSDELFDNVTENNPLLAEMKKSGSIEVSGGLQILENLDYGDNGSFKWFSGYEELNVSPSDSFTASAFDWKQANCNIVFNNREVAINEGENRIFPWIKSKTKNAERTMTNQLSDALYLSNTENDGKSPGGLQHLVADDPTTGTVGGINRATSGNEFWRNQIVDASVESITLSATTMWEALALLYRRTTRGMDVPNILVLGDTYHRYWEGQLMTAQRFIKESDSATAGFIYQMFKTCKVFHDPNCSATRGYMLNTNYIKLKSHKSINMKVGDPRYPHNQDATVIPLNWMGNLTTSNASLQGVLHA